VHILILFNVIFEQMFIRSVLAEHLQFVDREAIETAMDLGRLLFLFKVGQQRFCVLRIDERSKKKSQFLVEL
jgi:hypothetical protein